MLLRGTQYSTQWPMCSTATPVLHKKGQMDEIEGEIRVIENTWWLPCEVSEWFHE